MHIGITRNAALSLDNVLVFRHKCKKNSIHIMLKYIDYVLDEINVLPVCNKLTKVHSIKNNKEGTLIYDIEIFTPLNKAIIPPKGFTFIENLQIKNVIRLRYYGSKYSVGIAIKELHELMNFANIKPKPGAYVSRISCKNSDNIILETYMNYSRM